MRHCNHIWITSEIISEWDGHRTDKSELRTCIKCGLDSHAVYRVANRSHYASDMDKCMCDILDRHYYSYRGTNTDIICSPELAIAIYKKIIKEHPDITDEEVVFYLRQTLDEIRTIKVSDEVQKKRAKRLGLPQDFNKWDKSDVIN